MTALADKFLRYFYSTHKHPYRSFEERVSELLTPQATLLDAGCGRGMPVLRKYMNRDCRLIGVEMVDFVDVPEGIEAFNSDLGHIPLPDGCVDLIMSRSVFEHLDDPTAVYQECYRILRPGGHLVFLTANMWDYATLIAKWVPNRYHARIVKAVEGRPEEDTFPVAYLTNTKADVERLSMQSGLQVASFQYLNQYPNYLMFNGALFLIGVAYERITSRFNALRFLRGWILVTLKKPIV